MPLSQTRPMDDIVIFKIIFYFVFLSVVPVSSMEARDNEIVISYKKTNRNEHELLKL